MSFALSFAASMSAARVPARSFIARRHWSMADMVFRCVSRRWRNGPRGGRAEGSDCFDFVNKDMVCFLMGGGSMQTIRGLTAKHLRNERRGDGFGDGPVHLRSHRQMMLPKFHARRLRQSERERHDFGNVVVGDFKLAH